MPGWAEMINTGLQGWVPRERDETGRWLAVADDFERDDRGQLVTVPGHTWEAFVEVEPDPSDELCLWGKRGSGVIISSREGPARGDLFSRADVGSCDLYLEFMLPEESGVSVYLLGQYAVPELDPYDMPAGEWQTLEVTFRAPRFDESGQKVANARFERVLLNDALIHEDVECGGPSEEAMSDEEIARGPIRLRGNAGPVAFRDIRMRTIFE